MVALSFKQVTKPSETPWALLLLSEPRKERLKQYLSEGTCYLAMNNQETVGTFVVRLNGSGIMELMNISVDPAHRYKGIGRAMLAFLFSLAEDSQIHSLEMGISNSSIGRLIFLQKSGFRFWGIDHDFYLRNYKEPVFENGIQCRDMLRLAISFTPSIKVEPWPFSPGDYD